MILLRVYCVNWGKVAKKIMAERTMSRALLLTESMWSPPHRPVLSCDMGTVKERALTCAYNLPDLGQATSGGVFFSVVTFIKRHPQQGFMRLP